MEKEVRIVDYRVTEIGKQNWEVCARMLVHDLLDLAESDKNLKKILDYYQIAYLPNGAYTMALPRVFPKINLKKTSPKKAAAIATPAKKKSASWR